MDLEHFPTCETAQRMLDTVTKGFYDKSYVGKWLYQVMGLELEEAREKLAELRSQAFVDTAGWALPYWEQMYGLESNKSLSDEDRRKNIQEYRSLRYPMNPARMKKIAELLTGKEAEVLEGEIPCTFLVKIIVTGADAEFDERKLRNRIEQIKPSHMAYSLLTERPVIANLYCCGLVQQSEILQIRQVY